MILSRLLEMKHIVILIVLVFIIDNVIKYDIRADEAAVAEIKGAIGGNEFFDDFNQDFLSKEKWQFTIKKQWPPEKLAKVQVNDGYRLELDGNSYVAVKNGKLLQYVNCSEWYDTIRTWPIWSRPKDESQVYIYVWGVNLNRYAYGWEKLPKNSGNIGFLVALCSEYDQSYFYDRKTYIALKGLKPLSREYLPRPGNNPDILNSYALKIDVVYKGNVVSSEQIIDELFEAGKPLDLSWVVSSGKTYARWKRSDEKIWNSIEIKSHVLKSELQYFRLSFACSWTDYSIDAVQVSDQDLSLFEKEKTNK